MPADAKSWMAKEPISRTSFLILFCIHLGNSEKWKTCFCKCPMCSRSEIWGSHFTSVQRNWNVHSYEASSAFLPFLTPRWATVFLQIIHFARFHVNHRSAVSWRCRIIYCSYGFILQSSCSQCISCPLHWSVYFCALQIFWSSG
jgi:hypothetical protein